MIFSLIAALSWIQSQPEIVWSKQWGMVGDEWVDGIDLDAQGNIYISGMTNGNLFGQNQGEMDIFVVKLDSNGQVLWSRQLGTSEREDGAGLCVDKVSANIYLVTTTAGNWFGESLGERDIILIKLSTDGQLIWGKRIGTNKDEFFIAAAIDQKGHIYIIGTTWGNLFGEYQSKIREEGFLAKFDSDGNLVWGKQFKNDLLDVIEVDNQGNIYISGTVCNDINNNIVTFLAKIASDGTIIWRQELTVTENEGFTSLIVDESGNVYGGGYIVTYLDENQLSSTSDAFIVKYDGMNGQRLWSKRLKSQGEDEIEEEFYDVMTDKQGNVYAVGFAKGSLFSNSLGDSDIVIVKFDSEGNIIWGKQLGTDKEDEGIAITVDRNGNIYVAGNTKGNLFGINAGETDIFVVKFRQ